MRGKADENEPFYVGSWNAEMQVGVAKEYVRDVLKSCRWTASSSLGAS